MEENKHFRIRKCHVGGKVHTTFDPCHYVCPENSISCAVNYCSYKCLTTQYVFQRIPFRVLSIISRTCAMPRSGQPMGYWWWRRHIQDQAPHFHDTLIFCLKLWHYPLKVDRAFMNVCAPNISVCLSLSLSDKLSLLCLEMSAYGKTFEYQ